MFRVPSLWGDCSQRKMEQAEGKCSPLSAQKRFWMALEL